MVISFSFNLVYLLTYSACFLATSLIPEDYDDGVLQFRLLSIIQYV